jgi:DNA-binding transcriptional LysR family regulator
MQYCMAMPAWDNVRFFLEVSRAGTLAGAARTLDVDYTTVGRRMRAMERELGMALFERRQDRFLLTEAGEGIREVGERMEAAALALEQRALGSDRRLSGVVRVATTESMAQLLVLPAARTLRERHPEIRIHLHTGTARLDLARREADVAVRYVRPEGGDFVSRRLARMAAAHYGTRDYLARHPPPAAGESLRGLEVVAPEESVRSWARPLPEARVVLRANNMLTLVHAVLLGLGVGALYCWMAEQHPSLRRVWPAEPLEYDDLFLVLHKDVQRTGRVRAFIEALEERVAAVSPELEGRKSGEPRRG